MDIPCTQKQKETLGSKTRIRQNNFQTQNAGDKKGHYIMIKGSIYEEYITIINIYAPNIEVLKYIKQILDTKADINSD